MKLKKGIPVIDQGNKLGFWGGKFGGNFVPETLKKPIEDLEALFNKLKKDKKFIQERDKYFKNWIGVPTRFIKLENSFLIFSHFKCIEFKTIFLSNFFNSSAIGAHLYNA